VLQVRNLLAPTSQKKPVHEYDLAVLLEELGLSHEQFIDVCILCGCDYCAKVPGDS
jgi:flap endonuclease-1